jgi:hypothetical protein
MTNTTTAPEFEIKIDTQFVSLMETIDDDDGDERVTPAGSVGVITSVDDYERQGLTYGFAFPSTGGCGFLLAAELRDVERFCLIPEGQTPEAAARAAYALLPEALPAAPGGAGGDELKLSHATRLAMVIARLASPYRLPEDRSKWTREDGAAARLEGWDIWAADRLQLQRIDDPSACEDLDHLKLTSPVFADDFDAWKFVVNNPSPLHQKALAYLQAASPDEYKEIIAKASSVKAESSRDDSPDMEP